MQLKKASTVSQRLALAICSLVTAGLPVQQADAAGGGQASADIGALRYQEADGRVRADEVLVNVAGTSNDGSGVSVGVVFDTLSGGSPIGALPSKGTQTFTGPSGSTLVDTPVKAVSKPVAQTCSTPSGKVYACGTSGEDDDSEHSSIYSVNPRQLPLAAFHDERKAVHGSVTGRVAEGLKISGGGAYSTESDFESFSLNLGLTQDLNQKNTTVLVGLNREMDSIKPVGGTPVPWSHYDQFVRESDQDKHVTSWLLGITQVMTRRWLVQLNVSGDEASGYQNDPYKIVSILQADGSAATDIDTYGYSRNKYVNESRPEQRGRHAFYIGNKFALDRDTIDASWRHMTDDWGIASDTLDLRYRFDLAGHNYIEPHLRWYQQSEADFYHPYLLDTESVPFVSADSRLGKMTAQTIGVKLGHLFSRTSEFSVRFEQYTQNNTFTRPVLPQLQGLDLVPGLKATLVQADLQLRF